MSQMTKPVTGAVRQKQRRDRLKKDGFTQSGTWVHTDDQVRYKEFIETLRKPEANDGIAYTK